MAQRVTARSLSSKATPVPYRQDTYASVRCALSVGDQEQWGLVQNTERRVYTVRGTHA